MENKLRILLIAILVNTVVFAQTGSVKGKLTDNVNAPLMGANVLLKDAALGAQSDEYGSFEIPNLKMAIMF